MPKSSAKSLGIGMAIVLCSFSPAAALALTCGVTDPVGDFLPESPCEGITCPPHQDIVSASVSEAGGLFTLEMTMAAAVPSIPTMGPGAKRIIWAWNLNTDPATSPKGFPFDPATVAQPEFIARVIWDGTSFTGVLIDRRPLLSGAEAVVSPVQFQHGGVVLSVVVDGSRLGDPTQLQWVCATQTYMAHDETSGFFPLDRTANSVCGP